MNLKEKMRTGPVFGIAIFTGAACAVEAVGNHGYDFVFLDLEHTPLDAPFGMEKLIMAALRAGVSPLVRAASFGGPGFNWEAYIAKQNAETMVIPMDEDFEFTDNIEEIMASPCVDAVNFGPLDYALSIGVPIRYKMDDPKVAYAFKRLVELASPRGIGVMAPCVPPTPEYARELISMGANMLIMGNDMWHFHKSIGKAMEETVAVVRAEGSR